MEIFEKEDFIKLLDDYRDLITHYDDEKKETVNKLYCKNCKYWNKWGSCDYIFFIENKKNTKIIGNKRGKIINTDFREANKNNIYKHYKKKFWLFWIKF